MSELIRVKNLEKSYQGTKVIKGISFTVHAGEILCFLGPNGAGKSTTINILTGALGYEAGVITYKGRIVKKGERDFKRRLGIVPQEIALYEDISAEQNVRFFASLYGLRGTELDTRVTEALQFAGLCERAKEKVNTFSGGMKRRLNIACAIAHEPEILIMDEPTVGIDPQSRKHILNAVQAMREKGTTIIYTTHYMEEVEEISTRIIIMDQGQIIATGTKEKLKAEIVHDKNVLIEVDAIDRVNTDDFYNIEGIKAAVIKGHSLDITMLAGVENLDKLISTLVDNGVKIHHLTVQTSSLETVFLNLTGRNLRD